METDIHKAVKANDGQEVKALSDADTTAVNRIATFDGHEGLAPIHVAVRHGNIEMTALLYGLGADLELSDEEHQYTALGWAAYLGHCELAEMLVRFGANLSARCNPIQLAINQKQDATVRILRMYDDREETDE
ncbi:MAG: hypothetical protein CME21_10525 [Gemmatimonadetes bacterium]|jgi:ankyrin repeat protein|nr:hypothetical protein [Gemmatimonadota bacterium]HCK11056.1 hypothetical protein [Candidatus Latescibacterota bacterium]